MTKTRDEFGANIVYETMTPEPDPKTDPLAWLEWSMTKALMELLSDPRPLIYGDDGNLHYVEIARKTGVIIESDGMPQVTLTVNEITTPRYLIEKTDGSTMTEMIEQVTAAILPGGDTSVFYETSGRYLVMRVSVNHEFGGMVGHVDLQRIVVSGEGYGAAPMKITLEGDAALYKQFSDERRTYMITFAEGEPLR
jgi:hypothetical protein